MPMPTETSVSCRCWISASLIWSHSSTKYSQRMIGLAACASWLMGRPRLEPLVRSRCRTGTRRPARICSRRTTPAKRPPSSMTATEVLDAMMSSMALRNVLSGPSCATGGARSS